MIIGLIHPGSGMGDQLFSYLATRITAFDKEYEFGFIGREFFKGKDFMQIDFGQSVDLKYHIESNGKIIIDEPHELFDVNTPYFNPEFRFIKDGTVIDGTSAQDERYFEHRYHVIKNQWLKVEPIKWIDKSNGENVCVLNIRGGEFRTVPGLFLPKSYWDEAIRIMLENYSNMEFVIHTDDGELGREWFPQYPVIKDIEFNWRSVRDAKHLILSNSAFGILPALLGDAKEIIAPRAWANHNAKNGIWKRPQNYYKRFTYI